MADASLHLAGGNNITLSTATAASITSVTISGPATASQTVQTQNVVDLTLAGNTAGALALVSSGTATLAGGNNITVSQAGNAITISGPNVGGAQTGISGISNSETTYTSGTVGLSVVGGPLTIRSTTGNAFQFSASQSVQPETQTFIGAIKNTETTYTSGTVELEGTNNITVFSTTGQRFRISGANTHAQQTGISSIAASDTTYTSGSVQFTGSNMVTVKSSANQRVVIDATQTNQSAIKAFGASNTGNTAGNTGVSTGIDWVIAGTTNVTVSESTAVGGPNTLWLSGPNAAAGTVMSIGVSTGGATAGDTGVNAGSRFVLVGSDGMSLSQGTGANSTTVSIRNIYSTATTVSSVSSANAVGANNSRFALEAHIHEGVRRMGISTQGNTSGTTGINPASNFVFAGVGNLTLSQNTDAALNNTLTISAPSQTIQTATTVSSVSSANAVGANNSRFAMEAHIHEGVRRLGISTQGFTAGTTGIMPGSNIQFVGSGDITLSQSTDAASNITITFVDGDRTLSGFQNMGGPGQLGGEHITLHSGGDPGSWHVFPMNNGSPFPGIMTANTVHMRWSHSGSAATMSSNYTTSVFLAVYTRNVSTLSLLNTVSASFGYAGANANNSTGMAGNRILSFHSSAWSVQPVFTNGEYWIGTMRRTSGQSFQTFSQYGGRAVGGVGDLTHSGTMMVATVAGADSQGFWPFQVGIYSASSAAAPTSIGSAQLNHTASVTNHEWVPLMVFIRDAPQTY